MACHPTCCCSVSLDRCGRCDLLVDLEDFHLMSVARTLQALVLDVESCNQLVGCPGCGVIAHGHGRVVVEVIDAPWAWVPARIRWYKRRCICREHTCETVTFLERSDKVCAPINAQGKPRARTKPDAALSSGGGIARHEGPTRRRHAVLRLHVVQTPTTSSLEGTASPTRPGAMSVGAKKFARHGPSSGLSAKKLAQHAQKRRILGVLSAQGELFRAFAMIQGRGANFFAPK